MAARISFSDKQLSIKLVVAGEIIAHSQQAITLEEKGYQPVIYIPVKDINTDYLKPSEQTSYCPYKGQANYWHVQVKDQLLENVAWEYKEPYEEVTRISDHIAFYLSKIDDVYINDIKISSE